MPLLLPVLPDPQAQMQAAAVASLTPTVQAVAPGAIVRPGWPLPEAVGAFQTAGVPLVAVLCGDEKPSPEQPGGRSGRNAQLDTVYTNATDPTTGQAVTYVELLRCTCPLTLVIYAPGETGPSVRGSISAAIVALWGQVYALALPDDSSGAAGRAGLSARLLYTGLRLDHKEEARRIYRADLGYTATYSRYRLEAQHIIGAVSLGATVGLGLTLPSS